MMMAAVLDHLWQSTLVALGAALLTLAFRKAGAGVRYGLWFAASVKFLIPCAGLAALGRRLAPAIRLPVPATPEAVFIAQATQPFAQASLSQPVFSQAPVAQAPLEQGHSAALAVYATPTAPHLDPAAILMAVWALGSVAVLARWIIRSAKVRSAVRSATLLPWPAPMPVLASSSLMEPGLVGLWRPVLLIPKTLPEHLARPEIDAILAHEACHLRRRDNLTAAMHMLVEALFWFHPLVWWIGARLIAERERACDETVVRSGHDRAAYARSLVEICRFYLQSPVTSMAGASGSNLKTRVEKIMTAPLSSPLSRPAKALLLAVGVCAFATPVTAGLLTSPEGRQAVAQAAAMVSSPAPARTGSAPSSGLASVAVPAPQGREANPSAIAEDAAAPPPAPASAPRQVASAALAQPASTPIAKDPPSTTLAPLTVQGAAPPKMIEEQAERFVQTYAAVSNPEVNQIGRWHDPVCVVVLGLPRAEQAAAIKARIESVAQAVGLPAARAGCAANVEIVFTPEPQHVMDIVAKRREYLLGYYHVHNRDRLKTVTGPIQSWYVTSTSSFGVTISNAISAVGGAGFIPVPIANPMPTHMMGVIDDPENAARPGCGDAPHFTACSTSAFENVFMVADSKVLEGKDLGLVADYMAMLALSKPRSLDGCNALPGVIELFAKSGCPGRDPPAGLTPADAAYLTALYASDPEARRSFEESDIARRMAAILIKASAVTR